MVENRPGGESGIASVRCLSGDALWEAAEQGDWPLDLAQTAFGVVNTSDASAADGVAAAVGAAAVGAVRAAAGEDAALFELRHTDGFHSWLLHGQVRHPTHRQRAPPAPSFTGSEPHRLRLSVRLPM